MNATNRGKFRRRLTLSQLRRVPTTLHWLPSFMHRRRDLINLSGTIAEDDNDGSAQNLQKPTQLVEQLSDSVDVVTNSGA